MRKYAIGFFIGIFVASAFPVYGAVTSLVGQKVQTEYPVVVNGKQLETKAISINGVSYTPNRAFSDATGSQISFENKTVVITTMVDPVTQKELNLTPDDVKFLLARTNEQIEDLQAYIFANNSVINDPRSSDEAQKEKLRQTNAEYEQKIADLKERIKQLEAQLTTTP